MEIEVLRGNTTYTSHKVRQWQEKYMVMNEGALFITELFVPLTIQK